MPKGFATAACLLAAALGAAPAMADSAPPALASDSPAQELAPYLQCAPYARQVSGVQIFGDARSWWGQAQGRYATGSRPRVGAVMAFQPHRGMALGHVAAVSRVIDARTVLLDHANWSPIAGRRGQVEKDALAVDVSPGNDWSAVRVWYAPTNGLGTTAWPVAGFIYPEKAPGSVTPAAPIQHASEPSRAFRKAFAGFAEPSPPSLPERRSQGPRTTPRPAR